MKSRRRLGATARRGEHSRSGAGGVCCLGLRGNPCGGDRFQSWRHRAVVFQNFGTKGIYSLPSWRGPPTSSQLTWRSFAGRHRALSTCSGARRRRRIRTGCIGGALWACCSSRRRQVATRNCEGSATVPTHARPRLIAGLLGRGQIEGSVRADLDPVTLAWLVLSQIHARQFRRAHGKSSLSLEDDVLRSFLEALSRGGQPLCATTEHATSGLPASSPSRTAKPT